MPRKALIYSDEYPYHVYNRSNNKEFYGLNNKELWSIFCELLNYSIDKYNVCVHNFVLMDNHYHMDITTPEKNISQFVHYFQKEVARVSNRYLNRQNHFWGGRYKWSLITDEQYYYNIFKYIYQNPCRANMVSQAIQYPFSTVHELTGCRNDINITESPFEEFRNMTLAELNSCLNNSLTGDDIRKITAGLRFGIFKPAK